MSKIVILADLHFGVRNDSIHFHEYYEKFFSESFFPYLIQHNIKHVMQLGDIFDRRKYSNHFTLEQSKRYFFSKFEDYGIHLYTLVGNHDLYYKNTTEISTSSLFLSQFKNITVIDSPGIYNILGEEFTVIPWICDNNYQQCIDLIELNKTNICLGHFEIEGFKMYKGGISCEHGLKSDLFSKFEFVWSGHYHHKSHKGNISYLGTPYPMTWQDYGDQKGFHVFDITNRKLKFIKNPFDIFIKYDYDDAKITDTISSELLKTEFLEQFSKRYVKIQVVNKLNPYHFDLFVDKLYSVSPIDLVFIEDTELDLSDDTIVDETTGTLDIVNSYIESIPTDLDKNKIKHLMSKLYSAALSME